MPIAPWLDLQAPSDYLRNPGNLSSIPAWFFATNPTPGIETEMEGLIPFSDVTITGYPWIYLMVTVTRWDINQPFYIIVQMTKTNVYSMTAPNTPVTSATTPYFPPLYIGLPASNQGGLIIPIQNPGADTLLLFLHAKFIATYPTNRITIYVMPAYKEFAEYETI